MANNLRAMIGVKGIICLVALIVIVVAQLTYTATVNISVGPTGYSLGKSTEDWIIYTNDIGEVRYLPSAGTGGSAIPTFNAGDSDTWAFKVTTDTAKGMAVKIELVDYTMTENFTKFDITVMYNTTGTAWQSAQLYDGPTASAGEKSPNLINGTLSDFGYIHQARAASGTLERYYLIKVTYSYNSTATGPSVQFRYTPTPEDTL